MPKSKAMDGYKQEKDIMKCGINEANERYLARLLPSQVVAILGQDSERKSLREEKKKRRTTGKRPEGVVSDINQQEAKASASGRG